MMRQALGTVSASRSRSGAAWLLAIEQAHRMANDYAFALATIRRAAAGVSDPQAQEALETISRRLQAAALMHRALAPPQPGGFVELSEYLHGLCAAATASLLADRGQHLTLEGEPALIDAVAGWRIGLIAVELITNSVRHAFAQLGGSIGIRLNIRGDEIHLRFTDDGCASTPIFPGSGSAIVDELTAELGGRIQRRFGAGGSEVLLVVPSQAPHEATCLLSSPSGGASHG